MLFSRSEPHTPTLALGMPMRFERGDSFSATNPSRREGKLTYMRLNTQTPCPPCDAVPVNRGRYRRLFHSQRPDRFRSWMRVFSLCRPDRSARAPEEQASAE
jgi:hypothetical protein